MRTAIGRSFGLLSYSATPIIFPDQDVPLFFPESHEIVCSALLLYQAPVRGIELMRGGREEG